MNKSTKIETLKFANNYIYALKESINSMDTGKPANLPTSSRPPLGDIYSDRAAQLVHPELAAEMVRWLGLG